MGSYFKTNTDQLGQLMRSLTDAQEQLDEARKALAEIRSGEIGTSSLDEACDNFQECWKYGSEQIAEKITGIAEKAKATKQNYDEIEKSLEKAFSKSTK